MIASNMEKKHIDMLYFHIGEIRFCVDLTQTTRVLPLVALQQIPDAPDYLAGLMDLHGTSIPVIDLVYRLNLPDKRPYDINASIVLCLIAEKQIAFIVDEVDHIGAIDHEQIQLQSLFHANVSPLLGIVESEQGMTSWLALDSILDFNISLSDDHDFHRLFGSDSDTA